MSGAGRKHVLAVDEGTTGVTALVVDASRSVVGRAYREVPQSYPRAGWVEQDAQHLWDVTRATMRDAVADAGLEASALAAIGITNQRETTVLWDRRTGQPVAPAIVWQDRRTADVCAALRPRWQDTVRRRTGLVLDPYFSGTKLQWLLKDRSLRKRARDGELAFGTVDSWLLWKLTGRHATDQTNASRTLLMDIRSGAWDVELLRLFDVPDAVLPDIVPSSQTLGVTTVLGGKVPVAAMAGDQQAALFGQRCTRPGEAKCTYGTGAFLLQHTGTALVRSRRGLLSTRAASVDGRPRFALEGAVFTAGAAIQWLRDQLGILRTASEVDGLALQVPDAQGVHVVPAFTGLGAPYWDPHARAAVLGLTRGSDRRHLARAVLDGIALQCADVVEAMEKDSGVRVPRLRVDGGAARSQPLMQTQADLLQRPVIRPSNLETTAMGAALLAGLAVDAWTPAQLRKPPGDDVVIRPRAGAAAVKKRMANWRRAVAAARAFGSAS